MYSINGKDIIQDEYTKIEKKSILKTIINTIKERIENIDKDKLKIKTRKVLYIIKEIINKIIRIFPYTFILYPTIQLTLFIGKWILPLTPWLQLGWNDNFMSKVPIILYPTGHPWAFISIFTFSCFIVSKLNENRDILDKYYCPLWKNIIIDILIGGLYYVMFTYMEETVLWSGRLGIIFLILHCILANFGFYGSDYVPSTNHSTNNFSGCSGESSYSLNVDVEPIERTSKITNVRQNGNFVNIDVRYFDNGKNTNTGSTYSKTGKLQNWNESSVTIKDGVWYRQYGLKGEIINSWRDPFNE